MTIVPLKVYEIEIHNGSSERTATLLDPPSEIPTAISSFISSITTATGTYITVDTSAIHAIDGYNPIDSINNLVFGSDGSLLNSPGISISSAATSRLLVVLISDMTATINSYTSSDLKSGLSSTLIRANATRYFGASYVEFTADVDLSGPSIPAVVSQRSTALLNIPTTIAGITYKYEFDFTSAPQYGDTVTFRTALGGELNFTNYPSWTVVQPDDALDLLPNSHYDAFIDNAPGTNSDVGDGTVAGYSRNLPRFESILRPLEYDVPFSTVATHLGVESSDITSVARQGYVRPIDVVDDYYLDYGELGIISSITGGTIPQNTNVSLKDIYFYGVDSYFGTGTFTIDVQLSVTFMTSAGTSDVIDTDIPVVYNKLAMPEDGKIRLSHVYALETYIASSSIISSAKLIDLRGLIRPPTTPEETVITNTRVDVDGGTSTPTSITIRVTDTPTLPPAGEVITVSDRIALRTPKSYVQTDQPTTGLGGDFWFNPVTTELKIFSEDS